MKSHSLPRIHQEKSPDLPTDFFCRYHHNNSRIGSADLFGCIAQEILDCLHPRLFLLTSPQFLIDPHARLFCCTSPEKEARLHRRLFSVHVTQKVGSTSSTRFLVYVTQISRPTSRPTFLVQINRNPCATSSTSFSVTVTRNPGLTSSLSFLLHVTRNSQRSRRLPFSRGRHPKRALEAPITKGPRGCPEPPAVSMRCQCNRRVLAPVEGFCDGHHNSGRIDLGADRGDDYQKIGPAGHREGFLDGLREAPPPPALRWAL